MKYNEYRINKNNCKENLLDDNKKLEYDIFLSLLKDELEELVSSEKKIVINHVIKNNGVELDGVTIREAKRDIAPNIYVNQFFIDYIKGKTVREIAYDIIELNDRVDSVKFEQEDFSFEFNSIKDKIVYRVINYKKNKLLLTKVPHIRLLDMAVIFQYVVECDDDGMYSIRITNEHCKTWKKDVNALRELANINTPKLLPASIKNMSEVITQIMSNDTRYFNCDDSVHENLNEYKFDGKNVCEDAIDNMIKKITHSSKHEMYILSNKLGINGAAAMLYNDILKRIAKKMQNDIYILPSSVHEVILLEYNEEYDINELKEMVREVNITQVAVEDVLSDSIYVYKRDRDSIVIYE